MVGVDGADAGGRGVPGKLRSGEPADLVRLAAVAALAGIDPLRMLALDRADFTVAQAIAIRADEIALERKKTELEALARAVRM